MTLVPASSTGLYGVAITDAPSAGEVLTADSATAASWQAASSGLLTAFFDSTLGADTASFDITTIPGTSVHLRIILSCRSARAAQTEDPLTLIFNNDSGNNYDYLVFQFLGADSGVATASRDEQLAGASIRPGTMPAASSAAGAHAEIVIDIANYAATTLRKGLVAHCMAKLDDSTTNVRNYSCAGEWRSTAAITRVTLAPVNASFLAGSRCTAYLIDV